MADTSHSLTGRDYTAEFERVLGLYPDEITDRNHSDAGIVQARLTCRETDQLNAYIDRAFYEGFLRYCRFRQSAIEIGRLIDYLPTISAPATCRIELTRVTGDDPISIPRFSAFARADGLEYLTVADVAIQPGQAAVLVDAIQGVLVEADYEPDDFTANPWTNRPYVDLGVGVAAGTCEVWHGDPAILWTEVDSYWRSQPTDRHFLCELNGDTDAVALVLGDGNQGLGVPDETLHVRFVRTAGARGNCGAGTITVVPDGFDGLITCSNVEAATGGGPTESLAEMKRQIPAVARTQRRMVTKPDYEALVEKIAGVHDCQALDRNDSKQWPHTYVALYVVPDGGGAMSTYLKELIWAELGSWGNFGDWKERYILMDAISVPVNISARIGVVQGYVPDSVATAVQAAFADLLSIDNQTIGGTLSFADLHRVASAVGGVSWVEFDSPKTDTTAGQGELLTAGTIAVTVS